GEPGRAPGLPGRRLQTLIRGIHLAITVFYPNADISSARMKPRLSHGLHQQLILTPQLRQAIRLLQLSTVELEAEIAEAVASNPLLDWAEDGQDGPADSHEVRDADGAHAAQDDERSQADEGIDERWDREGEPWRERIGPASDDDDFDGVGERAASAETLSDHLLWQLHLGHFSQRDLGIGV